MLSISTPTTVEFHGIVAILFSHTVPMNATTLLDFSEMTPQYTRRKSDSTKKPVLISKALWMNFGHGKDISGEIKKHPNEVWLQYSYDEQELWSKVKGRKQVQPVHIVTLPEKYPNGLFTKSKKLDDLQRMIPFLPTEHRSFYQQLQCRVRREDSEESD